MAQENRTTRKANINSMLADNTTEEISPADIRDVLVDEVDSNFSLDDNDTDDIREGTKKFYAESLFDTSLASKDTDNLTEGSTNQYFTQARARGSFSAGTGIAISAGGEISVTASHTTYASPSIHNFSISGLPVGSADLAGNYTIVYQVSNSNNVSGNLSLEYSVAGAAFSTVSGTTIEATSSSASITLPTISVNAGQSVQFKLTLTDTRNATHESNIFTYTRTQQNERAYWGEQNSNSFAGYDTTSATGQADVQASSGNFHAGVLLPIQHYFYILVPSNRDATRIVGALGSDEKANFVRNANAVTIGGQQYIAYTLHNTSVRQQNPQYEVYW